MNTAPKAPTSSPTVGFTLRVLLLALVCAALSLGSLPAGGQSDLPYDHAAVWRAWDATARDTYVRGVVDGVGRLYGLAAQYWLPPGELVAKPESGRVKAVREKAFVREVEPQVPAVMTELYRDPTNAYVAIVDMVYIAHDRLEGKVVETELAEARKRALELHRLTRKRD